MPRIFNYSEYKLTFIRILSKNTVSFFYLRSRKRCVSLQPSELSCKKAPSQTECKRWPSVNDNPESCIRFEFHVNRNSVNRQVQLTIFYLVSCISLTISSSYAHYVLFDRIWYPTYLYNGCTRPILNFALLNRRFIDELFYSDSLRFDGTTTTRDTRLRGYHRYLVFVHETVL